MGFETFRIMKMNIKGFLNRKFVAYSLFAAAGLFLGWLLFHSPGRSPDIPKAVTDNAKGTVWTCAMHPQIRMDGPGKCPICGMDLISLDQGTVAIDPDAIQLTREAAALAQVMTSVVSRQEPVMDIRLYGKVQADERLLQSQTAQVSGRIEKLFVNFTGEEVRKGQQLALLYSPELITAQQELMEAAKNKETQPEVYEAARDRLRGWKISDSQITAMVNSDTVINNFAVISNTSGVVTSRRVNNGDHVSQGTVLFEVADLSNVWVMFDAYESDLPFLSKGEEVTFTVQAIPGTDFTGRIIFIDPVIDEVTRVAGVRVELNNQQGALKPGMFATGIVRTDIAQYRNKLVIPSSAILWTGKRSIVYVRQSGTDEPVFKMREIEIGPMLGDSYVVVDGLQEGEEIVTRGTFSVDAAAQLQGKPSMMNPGSEKTSTGHKHSNMP